MTVQQFTSNQFSLATGRTRNLSKGDTHSLGTGRRKKEQALHSLSPLSLSSERSPQSRGCCFPNPQLFMIRKRQAYPHISLTPLSRRLLAENEADESLAHNAKTQQQPLQPVLLSVRADCHTHPCLQNEAAAAQSHTRYITFKPKGLLKERK